MSPPHDTHLTIHPGPPPNMIKATNGPTAPQNTSQSTDRLPTFPNSFENQMHRPLPDSKYFVVNRSISPPNTPQPANARNLTLAANNSDDEKVYDFLLPPQLGQIKAKVIFLDHKWRGYIAPPKKHYDILAEDCETILGLEGYRWFLSEKVLWKLEQVLRTHLAQEDLADLKDIRTIARKNVTKQKKRCYDAAHSYRVVGRYSESMTALDDALLSDLFLKNGKLCKLISSKPDYPPAEGILDFCGNLDCIWFLSASSYEPAHIDMESFDLRSKAVSVKQLARFETEEED